MVKTAKSVLVASISGFLTSLLVVLLSNVFDTNQDLFSNAATNEVESKTESEYSTHAVSGGAVSVQLKELQKMGITVLPGAQAEEASKNDPRSLNKCLKTIVSTLRALPREHTSAISKLTLSFDPTSRRGLAGGDQMIIRCTNVDEEELIAVVIHEVGHVVDTGKNLSSRDESLKSSFMDGTKPVYEDDPSSVFYGKSFIDTETRKISVNELDFVSGYAMSDPFEDFAETYLYYILHGDAFRKLKETSPVLAEKYEFMSKSVFNNKEFNLEEEEVDYLERVYDGTKLKFSKEKILNI